MKKVIASMSPMYLFVLLIISLLLNFTSCIFATEINKQFDATTELASNAVAAGNEAIDLANTYKTRYEKEKERNEELEEANFGLMRVMSTYQSEFVVLGSKPPRYYDIPLNEELQDYTWALCCAYGIKDEYELIYAMMQHESAFNSSTISATDDYGLMQINKINHGQLAEALGITNFLDPHQNIHAGVYLYATLRHRHDTTNALMAYNMGERRAGELWARGVYETTYTETVMKYYSQFTGDI